MVWIFYLSGLGCLTIAAGIGGGLVPALAILGCGLALAGLIAAIEG